MTAPRQHADLAVRYFMDNTTNCWARNEGSNNEWTLMPDPRFNVPGLEYYVGHEPPPPYKHTIDNLRAQLAEAQRDAEVNKQINRACVELPDDFRIAIELERNAVCVYLLQEDEDIGFDDPFDGVASSISAAIDAAKGEPS